MLKSISIFFLQKHHTYGGIDYIFDELNMALLATMNDLRNTAGSVGAINAIQGYYSDNDGGEGEFFWDAGNSDPDNGGTIIEPTGGGGRWIRMRERQDEFPVRWYGAKGDGSTDDTASIANAIADATVHRYGAGIPTVYFDTGTFKTDSIELGYSDVQFKGTGAGSTRIQHIDGVTKPLVYFKGGSYAAAVPYGAVSGIRFIAGNQTYPSILYWDILIDNQVVFDDLGVMGSSATNPFPSKFHPCDGLSFFDFLNCNFFRFRNDNISGYGIRARASSSIASRSASTSNVGPSYRVSSVDLATGRFTFSFTSNELIDGTAVMPFTQTTFPVDAGTGSQLISGPAGGVYFAGSNTENSFVLYRTIADAKAGSNPITYTSAGSGTTGFATFQASFPVTNVDTTTNTLMFDNDKNIIIATSIATSGYTATYGSTSTYPASGAITSGGAGSLGGIHAVFLFSDGALPGGLSAGRAYYPIYVDAENIQLADNVSDAAVGNPISLTSTGSGNITILYDHQLSSLGVGGLSVDNCTYDNSGAMTLETVNGVNAGGLGLLYADYTNWGNKGGITFRGNRIEINKMIARDRVWGNNKRALFRVEPGANGRDGTGVPIVQLHLEAIEFEASANYIGGGNGYPSSHIRVVGNRGNGDIGPSFSDCSSNSILHFYDNDNGTAPGKTIPKMGAKRLVYTGVIGNQSQSNNIGRADGTYYGSWFGKQISPYSNSQIARSLTKKGDLLLSLDTGVAFYQATQSSIGWTAGTASSLLSIPGTVSGTAGSATFTLSANPSAGDDNFGIGIYVQIAGAGSGGSVLTGIIKDFDTISAVKTFTLGDDTGADVVCQTTVSGASMKFMPSTLAQVPTKYVGSASLSWSAIPAGGTSDQTISAPSGVTISTGRPVTIGLLPNIPAGLVFHGFVNSSGTAVVIRATNCSGGSLTPPSGTYRYEVTV